MTTENQISALEMSDEDFLNMPVPVEAMEQQEPVDQVVQEEQEDVPGDDEGGAAPEAGADESIEEGEETGNVTATATEAAVPASQADAPSSSPEHPKSDNTEAPKASEQAVDYKAAYERIFAPFKANGREIVVQSVEDAIALMQMGANYNKKMAGMKQHLKVLKMLEKHQLLDEEKLSYLIDLDKKDPGAINKLVKDSGLDPLDLAIEKAGEYQPNAYKVDDREIELDAVLDEIQETPTFNRVIDVVSNKWDSKSKQIVADHPQLLKIINDHMQRGVYDQIVAEVERERMFGRLNGLSDLDAYRQVGEAIQARNGFAPVGQTGQQTPPVPVTAAPNPRKEDDGKLREQRRAASPTRPAVKTSTTPEFDPLALSDEEFMKLGSPKFV